MNVVNGMNVVNEMNVVNFGMEVNATMEEALTLNLNLNLDLNFPKSCTIKSVPAKSGVNQFPSVREGGRGGLKPLKQLPASNPDSETPGRTAFIHFLLINKSL